MEAKRMSDIRLYNKLVNKIRLGMVIGSPLIGALSFWVASGKSLSWIPTLTVTTFIASFVAGQLYIKSRYSDEQISKLMRFEKKILKRNINAVKKGLVFLLSFILTGALCSYLIWHTVNMFLFVPMFLIGMLMICTKPCIMDLNSDSDCDDDIEGSSGDYNLSDYSSSSYHDDYLTNPAHPSSISNPTNPASPTYNHSNNW